MVGAIDRVGGLTSQNPLLAEWANIPLPKAVIPDPSGQSFSGIKFDIKPTFNTNFDPTLSLASVPPKTENPSITELLTGDEFATKFSQHTSGMEFGDILMMV